MKLRLKLKCGNFFFVKFQNSSLFHGNNARLQFIFEKISPLNPYKKSASLALAQRHKFFSPKSKFDSVKTKCWLFVTDLLKITNNPQFIACNAEKWLASQYEFPLLILYFRTFIIQTLKKIFLTTGTYMPIFLNTFSFTFLSYESITFAEAPSLPYKL